MRSAAFNKRANKKTMVIRCLNVHHGVILLRKDSHNYKFYRFVPARLIKFLATDASGLDGITLRCMNELPHRFVGKLAKRLNIIMDN